MIDFEFEKGSVLYSSGSGDELIARFNDDATEKGKDNSLIYVKGLEEVMIQCYTKGILPSEHGGIEWALTPETQILGTILSTN